MGSNPGYLWKCFLLYSLALVHLITCIWFLPCWSGQKLSVLHACCSARTTHKQFSTFLAKQVAVLRAYCLKINILCFNLLLLQTSLQQADSCSYSSRGCLLLKRARRLGFPITRLSSTAPLLYYYSAATFLKSLQLMQGISLVTWPLGLRFPPPIRKPNYESGLCDWLARHKFMEEIWSL